MADIPLDVLKERLRRQRESGVTGLVESRNAMDAAGARARPDPRISTSRIEFDDIRAEWLRPEGATRETAILYLHGGGFVAGSCISHRPLASSLALASSRNLLLLEYRLAPEHPWPAAELDALAAYRALLQSGIPHGGIAIVGDSAGGNLAVAATLRAREAGLPMPASIVLFSPWIDLDLRADSISRLAHVDPTLKQDALARYATLYRNGATVRNAFDADLSGFPRILIQAGSHEILLDDSVTLYDRLLSCGVDATLDIGPDLFHVWQAFGPWLPQARAAISRAAKFINCD